MIILIKAVLFDYGGVVGKETHEDIVSLAISKKIGNPHKLSYGFVKSTYNKHVEKHELTRKVSQRDVAIRFAKYLGVKDSKKIESIWRSYYDKKPKIDNNVLQIAKWLKKSGYRVGILSNVFMHRAKLIRKCGGYKIFNPVILSYKVGLRKPDKNFYRYALKQLRLKPQECVFIDDRTSNLKPAKKLGMKTMHFENSLQLERDLNRFV